MKCIECGKDACILKVRKTFFGNSIMGYVAYCKKCISKVSENAM